MKTILALAASAAVLIGAANVANARGQLIFAPYDAPAVASAVQSEQRHLLVFTKNGCPVCTRQVVELEKLLATPEFRGLRVWQVDVVKQKELAARYGVTKQSTLVVYDDGRELARRQGVTATDGIAALLRTRA
ncbi:MAG: thioredoxin family protein [Steroidobacteraceae bacterium]|jgi:thioredoxin-related protein|nr:thioredoxin family protein [Steroidobacteraceae bacterium]